MKKQIKLSATRQASLMGIVIWSAHFHRGQWSREYRMGCRARTLLERSNEIGRFLVSRWFDNLEAFMDDRGERPRQYTKEFSETAQKTYKKLAFFSDKQNGLIS